MNTVLQARPRNFVSTPTLERTAFRALRYLRSGYSVHLKGPAGTGKTTLALHLADLLGRPIMLLFGDDEFKTSDLIGNQSGYTRKKVVDNYIHSVMKVEDELRHNWIDSRLTLACREGFTLVYDEFNRSRPEVNNVLLSALEEKLLVLPPNQNRSEYIRVSPHFRGIFTSNPEEYCGVHGTQDALQDRLITINMPEPDELAQQQILAQKVGLDPSAALQIVRLVKAFQSEAAPDMVSSLRPCLMIATICHDHGIPPLAENADFRDVCSDVLLDRAKHSLPEATRLLWNLFNRFVVSQVGFAEELKAGQEQRPGARLHGEEDMGEDEIPAPEAAIAAPESPSAAPVAEDLVTEDLVTEDLITDVAVTEELVAEELATEDLVTEELVTDVAVTEELIAEEPVIEELVTEELIAEELVADLAVTETLVTEELVTEELVTEVAITEDLAGEELVTEELVTENLAAEAHIADLSPEADTAETAVAETVVGGATSEEAAIADPFMDDVAIEQPFMDEAVAEQPFAEEPFVEEPFMDEVAVDEIAVEAIATPAPIAPELALREETSAAIASLETDSLDADPWDSRPGNEPSPSTAAPVSAAIASPTAVSATLEAATAVEPVAAPVATAPAVPSPASSPATSPKPASSSFSKPWDRPPWPA